MQSDQSSLEKYSGHPVTQGVLTAAAATVGGALAPVVPLLLMSVASERTRKRHEHELEYLTLLLQTNEAKVQALSDAQYKLVNETLGTVAQTVEEEKLKYLRAVVENTLDQTELSHAEAATLSRVVRDVSGQEISFLAKSFQCGAVALSDPATKEEVAAGVRVPMPGVETIRSQTVLIVEPDTPAAACLVGLISLGLLRAGPPTWDIEQFLFTRLAGKLLALCTDPKRVV